MKKGNVETLKILNTYLSSNQRFGYVRYGDGDFIAMYPESKGKVIGLNNQTFINEVVQKKLIESYNYQDTHYLVSDLLNLDSKRNAVDNINLKKIKKLGLTNHDTVYSAIALQEGFLEHFDLMVEFFKNLREKKCLFVCHYYEEELCKFYGNIEYHYTVPKFNSTRLYQETLRDILKLSSKYDYDHIILSAGQLSRVLFKDLYIALPDKTILDCGSLSYKLIINTPSFSEIALRGHIRKNKKNISALVDQYIKSLK
jgi:hypothetical protein